MSNKSGVETRIISVDRYSLPEDLYDRLEILRNRFCDEAKVIDPDTGYIKVDFMNRPPNIDQEMLAVQANIVGHLLRYCNPTRIIGIPNSGLPLVKQVAKDFPTAKLIGSIKPGAQSGDQSYRRWKRAATFDVHSFTQRSNMTMVVEKIEQGERYLVIDDVAAWGSAANGFLTAIKDRGGIPVAYAVGFEKQFQRGIRTVAETHDIPALAVISILALEGNRVKLSQ